MNISHVAEQGTIVVAAGTRQKVITLSGGSPRLEERDFTNVLINVLRGAQPKAYFLHGHSEREVGDKEGEDGAAAFVDLLQKEAYKVEVLDIDPNRPEVPEDCSILIINGPKSDLLPQEIAALEAYAGRGGRLLVLLNPLSQRQGGLAPTPNLVSWLQGALGVDVGVDLILTDVGAPQKVSQIQLTPDRTPFAALEEDPAAWQGSYRAQHPVTRAFPFKMVLTAVRTVSAAAKAPQQTIVTELVRTPPDYWAETDAARWIETKGSAEQNEGEKAGPIPIAVAAVKRLEDTPEEGRPGDVRAVVVGDADLMTNAQIQSPGNFNLIFNVMAWLSESEDLIAIRASGKEDPPIVLTPLQQRAVVWTSTLATLQAVIGVGLVVYVVRRKHR
ncbi:MAG: Gldg family protein [Candidatus Hydrogenedentes bacterium]|nr:Gldg family protein [Candidatus Hydrogenedentota bacterium]